MDKDYFIKLTSSVYKLTLLFPKKEPLRLLVREQANEIMTDILIVLQSDIIKSRELIEGLEARIDVIIGYLQVAKDQDWVSPTEIEQMEVEYSKIREEIEEIADAFDSSELMQRGAIEKEEVINQNMLMPAMTSVHLTDRQEIILDLLKEHNEMQIKEVQTVLSEVTKRTLRRDLKDLVDKGKVDRLGEGNETVYRLS
jgi:DNA-binding transcriptional ArsR family regulator